MSLLGQFPEACTGAAAMTWVQLHLQTSVDSGCRVWLGVGVVVVTAGDFSGFVNLVLMGRAGGFGAFSFTVRELSGVFRVVARVIYMAGGRDRWLCFVTLEPRRESKVHSLLRRFPA